MEPRQELVILFAVLFIGVVALIIMLSVVLSRLSKQQPCKRLIRHAYFYSMLSEFIGGQIILYCGNINNVTGIIKDIKLIGNNTYDMINLSCLWTAENKGNKWKWTPFSSNDHTYFNLLKSFTLFDVDKAAIFEMMDKVVCLIMDNAQGVILLYPKNENIINIEDIDGYEMMLPIASAV